MRKSLLVAMTPSGVIADKGKMPWHLPEDLKRFRSLTMGHPIIMGRRTFEAIGKPLPGRHNIVVTHNLDFAADGVTIAHSVLEALIIGEQFDTGEVFVIGGQEIFKQAFLSCERIYLTLIEKEFNGDAFFHWQLHDWQVVSREYINGTIPHQNIILDKRTLEMVQWFTLERLENNDLPQPRYETPLSAGLDFAACLSRPCKKIEAGSGKKSEFWALDGIRFANVEGLEPTPCENKNRLLSISPGEAILIPLGFKCSFSTTSFLALYVRSSVGLKGLVLANGTGIVDPDYRGELFAAVRNNSGAVIDVKHGERIVQGILTPFSQGIIKEGKVDETLRGEGGFGSTGTMVQQIHQEVTEAVEKEEGPRCESKPATTENA